MKKTMIVILTFLFSFSALANTALDWQKVSLEEKVASKVKMALSKVLEHKQFMVETDIKFNDPGPPNFDDLNKVGMKISDVKFDDSKGDYIAFSKIGLEVPVIEKHYQDNQQRLKEMHRFNESYNLFKNLDKVNVKVHLSDMLPEEKINQAKLVVKNLQFSTGEVKPNISFEKMSLEIIKKAPKPVEKGVTLKDIFGWLSQFANAIGLIVATLLFGMVAKKILRVWEEIMENLKPKEPEALESEEEDEEELEGEEGLAADQMFEEFESEDFERFKKFLEMNKQDAVLMLKRWISVYDDNYLLSLKAVAQQLKDDELMELFSGLNDVEREKWKNALDEFLESEDIKVANKFISEEVVRTMIGPSQVDDVELIDMLLSLSDYIACKFVLEKKEDAVILMNLLTPQFSGRILDQLEEEQAQEVIMNSLDFDFGQITDEFVGFKKSLNDFVEATKRKPFNEKLVQMLPDFNPLKEVMLYEFLANSGMKAEMKVMATNNYPSELLAQLPPAFIKKDLQAYDDNARVILLASLEGDTRDKFMKAFAEEGSAAREMLDLDFEEIQNNQIAQAKIANKKDDIWKDFVLHTREVIKEDDEYTTDIEQIIHTWVDDLVESRASSDAAA